MSNPYLQDLLDRKNKIQEEIEIAKRTIETLQKYISERGTMLAMVEDIIKQAESYLQIETPNTTVITPNIGQEQEGFISTGEKILKFLSERSEKSARTSEISDTFANSREEAQRIHNAIALLHKQGKIELVKEYDPATGIERQRNRLYKLTQLI